MAEGGDLTSIKDGSDADFEFVCTPCGEDDIREEAVEFCAECNQYLCATCVRYHRRIAASKSHKLLDREDAKNASTVAMTTKCRYHPDRDIEMFCGAHDMVYCTKCIATEHRACENVKSIDDMTTSCVKQNEIQRLQDETKDIHSQLVATKKKKQKNVDFLEVQRSDVLRNIQNIERNIIERVGKLKREADANVNKAFSELNGELKAEMTLMTTTLTEVDKSTSMLQSVNGMDASQQFVQIKLIQRTVKDAKILFEKSESKGTRVARFTENADLRSGIMTVTDLGRVETINENQMQPASRQYKMKTGKVINVRMQNDSRTCFISDVCLLQDGTVIITDYNNKKVKRLDLKLNIKDHFDLAARPKAVCCTGKNAIAVKMYNSNVQFISVGETLSSVRELSVAGGTCWGMAYFAGELWISTGTGINVYSTSGTLLKYINKNVDGQNIFKSSTCHMDVSGDNVIVTDNTDGAVCLGRDGTVRRELRVGRLVNSRGVCVSSDGTVFLSGIHSHNIVMFSADGQCLGQLVSKEVGIKYPWALCYDRRRNCIFLTCNSDINTIILLELCD